MLLCVFSGFYRAMRRETVQQHNYGKEKNQSAYLERDSESISKAKEDADAPPILVT